MSKPKHTPGPWLIQKVILGDKEIKIVANGDEWKRLEARVSRDDCCEKTALANARLIASAPDMLAALEAVAEIMPGSLDSIGGGTLIAPTIKIQVIKDAKAAIAKAKGGQS